MHLQHAHSVPVSKAEEQKHTQKPDNYASVDLILWNRSYESDILAPDCGSMVGYSSLDGLGKSRRSHIERLKPALSMLFPIASRIAPELDQSRLVRV